MALYSIRVLFPAVMQGDRVEETIIAALDTINARRDDWDVVVIIRGGGATSDLSGFDTYDLAANCAQFPLPVITGIGHERDDTVLDSVSHTRVKLRQLLPSFSSTICAARPKRWKIMLRPFFMRSLPGWRGKRQDSPAWWNVYRCKPGCAYAKNVIGRNV